MTNEEQLKAAGWTYDAASCNWLNGYRTLPFTAAIIEVLTAERDAAIARAEAAEALAASRPDVSPEDARGWAAAREAFYEPTLDEKAAWERVDDALRAHAAKVSR